MVNETEWIKVEKESSSSPVSDEISATFEPAFHEQSHRKKRIAVLGGGMSSLSAVLDLTNDPEWKNKFDITVYQMGWRLGGKGASGRNSAIAQRIEEHGLHLWFGFYDHAFALIQEVYKENARPLSEPLATWKEAFKPYNFVVLEEEVNGTWKHWPLLIPPNDKTPGDITPEPAIADYIRDGLECLMKYTKSLISVDMFTAGEMDTDLQEESQMKRDCIGKLDSSTAFLSAALEILNGKTNHTDAVRVVANIMRHYKSFIEEFLSALVKESNSLRRLFILSNFTTANIEGIVEDDIIIKGFSSINHLDYRAWLRKHGASDLTVESALVRAMYSLAFSTGTEFAAGSVLHGALRIAFTYKGSFYYRMQAGMGDTVFAPIYEVLKKRGVGFKFFHKVLNLRLGADRKHIDSISIEKQVQLKRDDQYQPLCVVKGLPCWPAQPLFDQIVQGDELKKRKINLESRWAEWNQGKELVLQYGKDFDTILLGIPIGVLPDVAPELIAASEKWAEMIENVKTTPTQAFQVWQKADIAGLGWRYWSKGPPLIGSYVEPMDTYADMSDLIMRENWPEESYPASITYTCGPFPHVNPLPPPTDYLFPAQQLQKVKETCQKYLERDALYLWPESRSSEGNYVWGLLVDSKNEAGTHRLDAQYYKANVDPSEWYTLSVPNSDKYRIESGGSGFHNLVLTGDWVYNDLNFGCIEACVLSGKNASRVIKMRFNQDAHGKQDEKSPESSCLPMNCSLPTYIETLGNVNMPQPFHLRGTKLYSFLFQSDYNTLQKQLDVWFNRPSGGDVHFVPLLPIVQASFVKYRRAFPGVNPENHFGFSTEQELLFSYFVARIERQGHVWTLKNVYWFIPYLFVDNVFALVGGREDYGFNKTQGYLTIPDDPCHASFFAADTYGLKCYGTNAQAIRQPIAHVTRKASIDSLKQITDLKKMENEIRKILFGNSPIVLPEFDIVIESIEGLFTEKVPVLFLKQFRSIENPRKACYQAICTAPAQVQRIHRGGLLLGESDLELFAMDSYPIGTTLGLKSRQKSLASFWVEFDFAIENGSELWNPKSEESLKMKTAKQKSKCPASEIESAKLYRRIGGVKRIPKRKIAVLGGGLSSLSTIFWLTHKPDWKDRYEITVYQLGWRLGGKCASGRNVEKLNRIEEHGLHIWFGFYDNAFNLIRHVYEENDRSLSKPLARWNEAFKPCNFVAFGDREGNVFSYWPYHFPENNLPPGEPTDGATPWENIGSMIHVLKSKYSEVAELSSDTAPADYICEQQRIGKELYLMLETNKVPDYFSYEKCSFGKWLISMACSLVLETTYTHRNAEHRILLKLLNELHQWLLKKFSHLIDANTTLRKYFIYLDFALANIKGMILDDVLTKGYTVINNKDYRQWIRFHGAQERTIVSPLVHSIYCLVFGGQEKGNTFEAGTALLCALKVVFAYKGSLYYRMQAGMGDVVIAPIYEVLKQRGVKFRFFQKVESLNMNDSKTIIKSVSMASQVDLKDPSKEYSPLITVQGLPCWPSAPLYDQIADDHARQLRIENINLESFWTSWKDARQYELKRGEDYDEIVLGISVGAFQHICKSIISEKPSWRKMVQNLNTISTQSFQLWMKPDASGLGWPFWNSELPLMTSFQEPIDTWSDMSDLIIRENWPDDEYPNNLSYFVGPLPDLEYPPSSDHSFPDKIHKEVMKRAGIFLRNDAQSFWPNCVDSSSEFDWSILCDPTKESGSERLRSQYFRANVDPSERYVLSETGTSKYRFAANESGFDNMMLTGDWTNCGLNAGCVEASVMSGILCARALSGEEIPIYGGYELPDVITKLAK